MSRLNHQYKIVQQFVLASCLIIGNIQATGPQQYSPDLLQPREWRDIGSKAVRGGDMVILADGTKLSGYLNKVPALHYSFGSVCLETGRVAAIAFGTLNGEPKIQIITRDGQNFVAEAPHQEITFMEKVADHEEEYVPKILDPNSIHYIVLQQREASQPPIREKFYNVTLNNGDQVSVVLENEDLVVSDGHHERAINNNQLVEAYFNGGLRGTIEGVDCQEELGFSFVKDSHIGLRVVNAEHSIRMPWELIDQVVVNRGEYTARQPDLLLTDMLKQPAKEVDTKEIAYLDIANAVHKYVETQSLPEEPVAVLAEVGVPLEADIKPAEVVIDVPAPDMIYVPGGAFLVSVDESSVEPETGLRSTTYGGRRYTNLLPTVDKPSFLVEVAPFYADKNQVTNSQYAQFVAATGHSAPSVWEDGQIPIGTENEPAVNITYRDASAYAEWAGKRLPSEIEWQRASEEASALHAIAVKQQQQKVDRLQDQVYTILSLISGFQTVLASQDLPQVAFGRSVQGASGSMSEWTSSSAAADPSSPMGRVKQLYHANIAKYGDYRVIRSGFVADADNKVEDLKARWRLQQDDANATTGFRCIVDTL